MDALTPFTTSFCAEVALATPAASGVLIAANPNVDRYILGFSAANLTAALNLALQLETLGGIAIYRIGSGGTFGFPGAFFGPRKLPNSDNGMIVRSFGGATGAQTWEITVLFANTAPNFLLAQPIVIGPG